jgi:ribosomal protein S12 methylthiotransferase accessory factor
VISAEDYLPLVFLGPSLARIEAEALCRAEFRPPIRRGDLANCAGSAPRIIAIVDGEFYQSLAVSPNEVLSAMEAGHSLFGAASMGALRAVEMACLGMTGVGRVFEMYASGEIERDDEVAVTFWPENGTPLSEALVNMRIGFSEAVTAGLLDRNAADAALQLGSALYYPDRSYERVLECLGLTGEERGRLLHFLTRCATNQKAEDTRALLRIIARARAGCQMPLSRSSVRRYYPLPPRLCLNAGHPPLAELQTAPKFAPGSSVRTLPAATTNAILVPLRQRLGITRVADITGLDSIGIPCFSAIWPGPSVSAFSGKSLDPMEARVGAQMEALEQVLVHDDRVPMRHGSYRDLAISGRTLDPEDLPVAGNETRELRDVEWDWVSGWDLLTGEAVWVPADAVFFRHSIEPPPWSITSNGLASGNCLEEALAHGLAEVIERDALTLHALETENRDLPNLLCKLAGPARRMPQLGYDRLPGKPWSPFINLGSLPEPLSDAIERVKAAGAKIDLRWVGSDVAVPVFLCAIYQEAHPNVMFHSGAGAHPDACVAARRAVTEAAQSRAAFIQGVREDLVGSAVRHPGFSMGDWFTSPAHPRVDFETLPTHEFGDVVNDLEYMVSALIDAGLSQIIAVDLSHAQIPLSVVRLIVPDAEPLLELGDRTRLSLGWRARQILGGHR